MCTIGVVFKDNQIHTFKQCDLIPKVDFNEPIVIKGVKKVGHYTAMTRGSGDNQRVWAGVNDAGVSFIAADSYTTTAANYSAGEFDADGLFKAYEKCLSDFATAPEAANFLAGFYKDMSVIDLGRKKPKLSGPFPAPDISMITGWKDEAKTQPVAIFIEYMPNPFNHESVRLIERTEGHFASTNNFRLQPDSVNYPANHSTYLRLNRAEAILQSDPSLEGVKEVLSDQYYGETELSICRVSEYGEFHTQATAIFTVNASDNVCEYQINGNPKSNPLKEFKR